MATICNYLEIKPILYPQTPQNEIQTARSADGFNREREASKSCEPC